MLQRKVRGGETAGLTLPSPTYSPEHPLRSSFQVLLVEVRSLLHTEAVASAAMQQRMVRGEEGAGLAAPSSNYVLHMGFVH